METDLFVSDRDRCRMSMDSIPQAGMETSLSWILLPRSLVHGLNSPGGNGNIARERLVETQVVVHGLNSPGGNGNRPTATGGHDHPLDVVDLLPRPGEAIQTMDTHHERPPYRRARGSRGGG